MSTQSNIYTDHCDLVSKLHNRVTEALALDMDPQAAGIVKDSVNAYAVAVDKLATFHSPWVVAPDCKSTTLKDALNA